MPKKTKLGIGTPSFLLLPANNYHFKIIKENVTIKIPLKGRYEDFVENSAKALFNEAGSFVVFSEDNKIIGANVIIKLLFATKQYPRLGANQMFSLFAIELLEEELVIFGHIIEFITKTAYDKELADNESETVLGTESL